MAHYSAVAQRHPKYGALALALSHPYGVCIFCTASVVFYFQVIFDIFVNYVIFVIRFKINYI